MNEREKLFRQRGLREALLPAVPFHQRGKFLLEKVEGEVLFGFEIIEKGALGDFCFAGNLPGGCFEKSVPRKKAEGGVQDLAFGFLLVFSSTPALSLGPFSLRFGVGVMHL